MATHSSVLAWRIPEDGGAWWVAIYGVAQSQTRLKRLSSSSSSSRGKRKTEEQQLENLLGEKKRESGFHIDHQQPKAKNSNLMSPAIPRGVIAGWP